MATIAEIAAHAGLSPSTVSLVLRKKPPYSEEAAQKVAEAVKELEYQPIASTVTARDVAALAGVSVATVSNVVNGYPVSAPFKKMVTDAMRTLGYIPPAKKNKATQKKMQILVVDDLRNQNLTSGIFTALEETSYNGFLLYSSFCTQESILQLLEHGEARGVIFCNYQNAECVSAISKRFPTVQCGYYADQADTDIITIDHEGAAYELTKQLLDSGKHRPALIATGAENAQHASLCEYGFRRACLEAGFPASPDRMIPCSAFQTELLINYEQHRIQLQQLLSLPEPQRPDALLLLNAQLSLVYHRLICEVGLAIPNQFALACTDASLAYACSPPLAAMSYPCVDMGAEAVRQLLYRIDQPNRICHRTLFHAAFYNRGSI